MITTHSARISPSPFPRKEDHASSHTGLRHEAATLPRFNPVSSPFQPHFNPISTPFQPHFNPISTPFYPRFNPISTPFCPLTGSNPTWGTTGYEECIALSASDVLVDIKLELKDDSNSLIYKDRVSISKNLEILKSGKS